MWWGGGGFVQDWQARGGGGAAARGCPSLFKVAKLAGGGAVQACPSLSGDSGQGCPRLADKLVPSSRAYVSLYKLVARSGQACRQDRDDP